MRGSCGRCPVTRRLCVDGIRVTLWEGLRPNVAACHTRRVAPTARTLADFVRAALMEIEEISPEEAREILDAEDRGGFHFVDVREADEFAEGHVPGARNCPRGFLEVRADKHHHKRDPWLEDRQRRLILYCGGGNRSALAAQTLQQMGFKHVCSLREGWSGWDDRGYPVEK